MSFLLIICVILVSWSLNFSHAAFQSHFTYGNETDCLALLWFKSKTTYYKGGALVSWKNHSDHCTWPGIKCNREHPRRVTVLDLSHQYLGDYIPPVIGNLTFLMTLRLSYNKFNGEIPQEIGRLFRLQFLDLSHNSLSGEIPSPLKNCLDLKGLYLSSNYFEGIIPQSLQSLKGIQELMLGDNGLSGPIPAYLESFHSLKKMNLSYNQLSGEIPEQIGRLFELQFLDLSYNQLSGEIPEEIGRLFKLQFLDLSDNHLSGEIPQEIGRLFYLQFLDSSDNYFSGEIPRSLNNCLNLKGLYLSGNYFKGIIPPSFQSLKAIQELILDRNNLSGPIPEYLESFSSLKTLNLSWNNFQGEVPSKGIFNKTSPLFNFYYDGNKDLCGGNPLLQLPSCSEVNKHFPLKRLLLLLSGVVISVIILGSVRKFLSWRKARNKPSSSDSDSLNGDSSQSPFTDMFHKVSYKELFIATNGFSAKNLVGVGGYGSVYIGILMLSQEITSVVAVKVLDLQRRGALKSFKAECEALRFIRHRNVLKILTSCSSVDYKGNQFKALVYEYMPNGSLENWLHPTANNGQHQRSTNRPLKFIERLSIAIDVASALDYLHRQCQTPIAHCDLKPSNVLLDEDMNGHLGDFGSAKFLHGVIVHVEPGNHCSTSLIRGSIGYVAPEYGMGRAVSTNGDLFSFGILLLELFTGSRPTANMFKDGLTLHSFAKTALTSDRFMQIVDHTLVILQNNDDEKNAKLCEALTDIIELGVSCSTETPKERMEMELVVQGLQSIKNVFLSREWGKLIANTIEKKYIVVLWGSKEKEIEIRKIGFGGVRPRILCWSILHT